MKKLLLLSVLLIFACSSDSEGNPCIYEPTLETNEVTDITETSATLNGLVSIVSENCDVALGEMQGFVYSTNPSPTNDDNVEVVYGTDINTTIDNLTPNTTYYVRVFITNSLGEFYGNEVSFNTNDDSLNPVYLAENGITIKAKDWAEIGDSGVINGIEYTVVNREMLEQMILEEQDVSTVCTSRVNSMNGLFSFAFSFNQDISNWDVSNVTNMRHMFSYTDSFNQDISQWDVSNVTNMSYMFAFTDSFNQPIGNWDVSNVTDMDSMFFDAISFNQAIGNWDVSNVTNMMQTFRCALSFNQPIGDWEVSSVTNMSRMFGYCDVTDLNSNSAIFNQDISNWDVSNVSDFSYMFQGASYFNQDISNWDVSNVFNFTSMFEDAISFNQDLSSWNIGCFSININQEVYCGGAYFNTPSWNFPRPDFKYGLPYEYDIIGLLTNNDSRVWRVAGEFYGHFGIGPYLGGCCTYWEITPYEVSDSGIYDDSYIFNIDGTFTHMTNNTIAGIESYIYSDLGNNNTGTVVNDNFVLGPENEDFLINYQYENYAVSYELSAPAENYNAYAILSLSNNGFLGFYNGAHTYDILLIDEDRIILRYLNQQASEDLSNWIILVSDE